MRRYNPKEIEPKWQQIWDKSGIYKSAESKSKPKKYVLEYFPYPSGATMHVGHVRNYTIGDTLSRFMRMRGDNVLHPMGWDAFGLPAENYAIKNNISPRVSTEENIKTFKQQLTQMGFSYDWSREINSSSPDYYKWTQWLFLKFYEKDLAYRAKSLQNWCPTDKTVLANEQVINKDGVNVCERDGTPVVQKELEQWFLKITDYADRLVDDLEDLDWPEGIKAQQRNWIGRSKGIYLDFEVAGSKHNIKVFTTRPDTIYGATYMVLAPEHPLIGKITTKAQEQEVNDYIKLTANKTELDRQEDAKQKTGVFTGAYAINPANKEKIPVWISDYVLMGYGTGAIMAVPAHDKRDGDFAKKYKLPIVPVIEPLFTLDSKGNEVRPDKPMVERQAIGVIVKHWSEDKYLCLKWKKIDWETFITGGVEKGQTAEEAAIVEIKEETGYEHPKLVKTLDRVHSKFFHGPKDENRFAHFTTFYFELEDGAQSKVSDEERAKHELVWLSAEEISKFRLPNSHRHIWEQLKGKLLPYEGEGILVNSNKYDGMESAEAREKITADLVKKGVAKEATTYRLRDWTVSRQRYWGCPIPIIYCDKDGALPVPEEDLPVLLPEDVEFKPTGQSPLKDLPGFVNVKCPKCGGDAKRETDTFDTFIDSSWYFLRFAAPQNDKEPFSRKKIDYWLPVDNYIGGAEHAVVHLLYARFWTKFLNDAGLISINEPFKALRNQGMIGGADGLKMGKRYGNVITPDELIQQGYGSDSLRLYELFIGPYSQGLDWNPRGIAGTYRFLDRLWTLIFEFLEAKASAEGHNAELEVQIKRAVHKAIKKVSQDLEILGFNTAIAAMMERVNELYKVKTDKNFALARDTWQENLSILVQLLAPMAPHVSEELWQELGHETSVHLSSWPQWDEELVKEETLTLAIQINGKLRSTVEVEVGISEAAALEAAKKDEKVAKLLAGKKIKKEIYVPGRLVSLVI